MRRGKVMWWAGALGVVASVVLLAPHADGAAIRAALRQGLRDPLGASAALLAYAVSFGIRAELWSRVLPTLARSQAMAALHVSLVGNHILPLRLGEALRVASVVRRTDIPTGAATASTLTLRAADVIAVVAIAAVLSPRFAQQLMGGAAWVLLGGVAAVGIGGVIWLRRVGAAGATAVRLPAVTILLGATAAWVLESGIVWQATQWAGLDISFWDAVLVTAVTIAAQTLAVTPGGIGTYELAATAALVALGAPADVALAAAITAHAVKSADALVPGGVATVVPSPGLFGRLRLPRPAGTHGTVPAVRPAPNAPVVLFMPAHNEEDSVAAVVRRAPSHVAGHPVEVLVIDDGSTDATAQLAEDAGATVVRVQPNRGLGAAVRRGLQEGVAREAAAVVFCDADGEYAPEELATMTAPILDGSADYVVGSRFAGDIRRMLPHRRFGNRVLTILLRFVARTPISDGQSGYRALSPAAAADAEVIHDFNYAQVLTLDLLGKGYRYAEVPISYGFREDGRSFVRLGRYLRTVIPAVHRELNTT